MAGNYPKMNDGLRPERIEMPQAKQSPNGPETMGQPALAGAGTEERRPNWLRKAAAAAAAVLAVSAAVCFIRFRDEPAAASAPTKAASMYTSADEYVRQRPLPAVLPAAPKPAPVETPPVKAEKAAPAEPAALKDPPTIRVRQAAEPADKTPSLSDQKLQAPMMGAAANRSAAHSPAQPAAPATGDGASDGGRLGELMRPMHLAAGTASRLRSRSFTLAKGTFINCIMETAVDTSVPGMTSCRIPEDVFSMDGRTLLIEAGSRALGEYRGGVARGMNRIFMLWSSIITPEGVEIRLDSPAADSLGRTGLTGDVDHHWWARFGNALLFSIIDDAFQFAMTQASSSDHAINNYDSTDSGMSRFLSDVIRETGQIPPTITMNQGMRVGIFVARHIDLSSVYRLEEAEMPRRTAYRP